ncbi:LysE family translocator [Devosia oryziradicis]|uniref:LysE family translocator n=1 Tax=Devosia oryziradicis TaxID=2801335 RepID=A0ABX7BX83_9HYPH|nr:LysE family translocator [Devosia oryziradicis]QQR35217.1 LysE family translocator [Devosia oryziradicis]
MIEAAIILPYVLACLLFAVIPGPSVSIVIANSLAGGTRAGLFTILGTALSMISMVFIVAVGLEAVMTLVSGAFEIIKLAGAAYLIWIGWKMFRSNGQLAMADGDRLPIGRYIWQGALTNWSNPKTLLFLSAFLPQFVDLTRPAFGQIITLGLICLAVAAVSDSVYAFAAGQARHLLSVARVRLLNRVSGVILMAGGIWLALQKRA